MRATDSVTVVTLLTRHDRCHPAESQQCRRNGPGHVRCPSSECMNDDAYYLRQCKLSLLVAAAVHWIGAAMLLSNHLNDESTWQYLTVNSPTGRRRAPRHHHRLRTGRPGKHNPVPSAGNAGLGVLAMTSASCQSRRTNSQGHPPPFRAISLCLTVLHIDAHSGTPLADSIDPAVAPEQRAEEMSCASFV